MSEWNESRLPWSFQQKSLRNIMHSLRRYVSSSSRLFKVQRNNKDIPFPNPISKVLDPVGFVKWKMGVIDSARGHYEHCSDQFQNGPISQSSAD
jgi:hypothetical protein